MSGVEDGLRDIAARLASEQNGVVGVAATFLPTGQSAFYNEDETFPTASVIKIAIVSELFTQAAEGRLSLGQKVTVTESDHVAGSGVLATLAPGVTLPLSDLAMLTISVSDNTASNLCLAAVGGPNVVNARMQGVWDLGATTIHRPIKFGLAPGDPPHTATGTARDMLRLVTLLHEGQVHDRTVSDGVLRLMGEARDNDLLGRYLEVNPYAGDLRVERPPFRIQHKAGAVNGVRNDAALIRRGGETLAVCVYSKGVSDSRWTCANAGAEAVAQIGRLLSEHFFA